MSSDILGSVAALLSEHASLLLAQFNSAEAQTEATKDKLLCLGVLPYLQQYSTNSTTDICFQYFPLFSCC